MLIATSIDCIPGIPLDLTNLFEAVNDVCCSTKLKIGINKTSFVELKLSFTFTLIDCSLVVSVELTN